MIIGHVYPVWFDFRGGKGAATVVGVVAAVDARLLVPLVCVWCAVLLLSGYVGLASMVAALALVVAARLLEPHDAPLLIFSMFVAAFVIFTHRVNIARMRAGKEHRVRRLWQFRSRAA